MSSIVRGTSLLRAESCVFGLNFGRAFSGHQFVHRAIHATRGLVFQRVVVSHNYALVAPVAARVKLNLSFFLLAIATVAPQRARPMSTPNWLRFRAGEKAHVVTGMSGPMHLVSCGYAAHGATGVADKLAKKCRACSRAVRPVSPQERRIAGHAPE